MDIEEKYIDSIDGSRIRYLVTGKGPTLVCLSGWMGTAENFIPLFEYLSKKYQCIAIDLPGFGKSPPFKTLKHTVENYGGSLEDFLKKTGETSSTLLGISMGGSVILLYNLLSLNPAKKVILQSVAYEPIKIDLKGKIQIWVFKNLWPITVLLLLISKFKIVQNLIYFFGDSNVKSIPLDQLKKYGLSNLSGTSMRAIWESADDILNIDLRGRLSQIPGDKLVIFGEKENLFKEEYQKELLQEMPLSRFINVPNGSHFLIMQKPEVFADIVGDFLKN